LSRRFFDRCYFRSHGEVFYAGFFKTGREMNDHFVSRAFLYPPICDMGGMAGWSKEPSCVQSMASGFGENSSVIEGFQFVVRCAAPERGFNVHCGF
jgi:hypothetical protein